MPDYTPTQLERPPLSEAMLEVHWSLEGGTNAAHTDPGYQLLLGRIFDRVQSKFPVYKELPASQVPEELAPYLVRHQFRVAEDRWPVIQLGPGVLTVNFADGYSWEAFRAAIVEAVEHLFAAYPTSVHPLRLTEAHLRYQNAIPVDPTQPILASLRELLHTTIQFDPTLFEDDESPESPIGLVLRSQWRKQSLPGVVTVTMAKARQGENQVIALELIAGSIGKDCPETSKDLSEWIDRAHSMLHNWFFSLCRDKLIAQFGVAQQ